MKMLNLITSFDGASPRLSLYKEFFRNVVMEGSPFQIKELGARPGDIQEVHYRLARDAVLLCSFGTPYTPDKSACVDITFEGGATVYDWKKFHYTLVHRPKLPSEMIETKKLGSPFFTELVGNPDYTMMWQADRERFMDLRDAIQHGFSAQEASSLMIHFRRRVLWAKAALIPCKEARQHLIYYFQNAFCFELAKSGQPPHAPREWEAYCHVTLCPAPGCKKFANHWENILLQTKVYSWMKLYSQYENRFREWGIVPR